MTDDRILRFLLRIIGGTSLLAIVPVLMPGSWMSAIHHWLGMGTLPADPAVGYLARSTSAFYAMLGGLLLLYSTDLARYRPALRYVGLAAIFFGVMLLGIDYREGMPPWWTLGEGPFNMAFGLLILWLNRRPPDAG